MILRSDADRDGIVEEEQRPFEYLVDYPCDFEIKIIGFNNQGDLASDMAIAVGEVCEVEAETVKYTTRDTNSGKYRSITMMAPVQNAEMLYKVSVCLSTMPFSYHARALIGSKLLAYGRIHYHM
jgi:putative lipoic acid-binding regulatory protein